MLRDAAVPLNSFVYFFALPAFLFDAVAHAPRGTALPVGFFLLAFVLPFATSAATYLLARRKFSTELAGQLSITVSYGNVGYFGFPIILAVLGPAAALPAALGQQIYNLIYMIGFPILRASSDHRARRRAILRAGPLSPFVIALVLGLIVYLARWELPAPIATTVSLLGGATIPVALFAIGLALGEGGLSLTPMVISTLIKNLGLPLITWGAALLLLPAAPVAVGALVLLAAMPTGVVSFNMAQQHDSDARPVAVAVAMSTVLALLTVPLFGWLVT